MAGQADLAILISAKDEASRVIDGLHSSLGKLGGAGGGGGVFSGITSGMGSLISGLGQVGLAVGAAQMAFEGIKSVGSSVFGLGALNEMEQVTAKFNAFTKDSGATQKILADIRAEAAKTPFAFGEMANAAAALQPVAKTSGIALMDMLREAEILAASNPLEGLEGASFALKEAMTGDFTSIIERFNLSRSSINQWKAEGVSNMEIVRRAMKEMGMDADLVAAMGETLQGRWSTFKDTLTTLAMKMGEPIFNALKDGLVSLQGLLDGNMPLLESMAEAIGSGIRVAIEGAKAAFTAWAPVIQQVMTGLAALLDIFLGGDSFDVAAEMLDQVFGPEVTDMILDMVAIAGDAVRELAATMLEWFGKIVGWVRENWPLIKETILTVLRGIAALWREHGDTIMTVIRETWTIIKTVVEGALDIVLSVVKAAMQLITGDWEGAWETISGLAERTLDRLGTIFESAFRLLFTVVNDATGGMLTSITDWMSQTAESITSGMQTVEQAISTGWETAKSTVAGILPTIRDAIMAVWNALPEDIRTDLVAIATHITTQGAAWVSAVTTAGASMLSAITSALGSMVSAVTSWAGQFLAPITGLVGTASGAATSVGEGILSAITAKLSAVISAVSGWAGQVVSAVSGIAGSVGGAAAGIGQAIVSGITNAISGGIGAIRDMAYRAARAALDAAKAALGIQSPSLVFKMEVGKMIPAGIIEGIKTMQRPLDSAVSGMVRPPLAPAFAGGGAVSSGGGFGGSVVVNFHGPVYGHADFQDQVIRAVEEARRRARS